MRSWSILLKRSCNSWSLWSGVSPRCKASVSVASQTCFMNTMPNQNAYWLLSCCSWSYIINVTRVPAIMPFVPLSFYSHGVLLFVLFAMNHAVYTTFQSPGLNQAPHVFLWKLSAAPVEGCAWTIILCPLSPHPLFSHKRGLRPGWSHH